MEAVHQTEVGSRTKFQESEGLRRGRKREGRHARQSPDIPPHPDKTFKGGVGLSMS